MPTNSLSATDQKTLDTCLKNASAQENAVMNAWAESFGTEMSIDAIVRTINFQWATNPPSTLTEIQNAPDIMSFLGNSPAAGAPILDAFTYFIRVLGPGAALLNERAMLNNDV
jgi:hypothetical protein